VNWRDQRGMTVIEVLAAMVITSLVLIGITGVLFVGYRASNQWSQKLTEAQTINQLSGWLAQDTHRYLPCAHQLATQPAGDDDIYLCLPANAHNGTTPWEVWYTISDGSCPCTITRRDHRISSAASVVVARDLLLGPPSAPLPIFHLVCNAAAGNIAVGEISVPSLTYPRAAQGSPPSQLSPTFAIYFRAPVGGC
jgi:prepilin-type N-terminal cleavage/methylation domain-containing protein